MEHGAVAEGGLRAACENLSHTYLTLGGSTSGGRSWQETGFTACAGPLEHPICNFAVDIEPTQPVAARLREIAAQQKSFSLYLVPPNDTEEDQRIIEDEGFTLSHRLRMMVADEVPGDTIQLAECSSAQDRRKTAEFMMDQFFHRQPTGFKRGIAEATAGASGLKLYKAEWNKKLAGAVMISEHAGMLGIYNLCVSSQFRRRGWGSAIVRSVVEKARSIGYGVTLQCEPGLAAWYGSLGFREVGSVSVYGLFRFKEIDIISVGSS